MSTDATGTAPAPAAVPDPGTAAPAAVPDKGDFEARVRQGGEFALEQVKNAQREATRLQGKYKDIDPVIDAVGGGDALMNHLRRLNTLVSNPAMRTVIEQFETTGTVPAKLNGGANRPATAGADDDAEDAFDEPWTKDLAALRQENATLRADLNSVRGERGVEKVQGFFKQFEQVYPLDDEARQHLAETLQKQAQQWAADPQGLNVLRTMNYETFESLALGKLGRDRVRASILRDEERRRGQRASAATDVPSGVRTQAREAPADMSPAQAFEEACRQYGLDPRKPLV